MQDNTIQLAVVDMAGTTVADDGLVVSAFEAAATAVGVPESGEERERARQYVLDTMGQSKISVFRALFGTEDCAQRANTAFERAYERAHRQRAGQADRRCGRSDFPNSGCGSPGGAHHRVQRHHPGEAAGRAWLAVPGRSGARAGRRCARTAVSRI